MGGGDSQFGLWVSQKVTFYLCNYAPDEFGWLWCQIRFLKLHTSLFTSCAYTMRYWNMNITNFLHDNEVYVMKTYVVNTALSFLNRSCLPRVKMLNNLVQNVCVMLKLYAHCFWSREYWFNQKIEGRNRFLNFCRLVSQKVTFYLSNNTPVWVWLAIMPNHRILKLHKSIFIGCPYLARYWNMSITNIPYKNEADVMKMNIFGLQFY